MSTLLPSLLPTDDDAALRRITQSVTYLAWRYPNTFCIDRRVVSAVS